MALFTLRLLLARDTVAPNFDTATVGLMGLDILRGARPLFYYGQNYMGALEAYIAAGFFAIFGPSALTLAAAPILFSVGWAAATWALARDLYGRAAAWAAFALAAVPGWTVLRIGLNSYGGYTACYFFGTLAWWSALRWWRDAANGWLVLCGACAGLALWTNFQSAIFLFPAALLVADALRSREPRAWAVPALLGGALFAIAMAPVVLLRDTYQGGHVAALEWSGQRLSTNLSIFTHRLLGWMVYGRPEIPALLRGALIAVFALAAAHAVWTFRVTRGRWVRWTPVWACLFFLVLYLPHPLASEGASRYLVAFWSVLCVPLFAAPMGSPARAHRMVAIALLLLWVGLNLVVWGFNIPQRRVVAAADRQAQSEVVAAAARMGLDTVIMSHGMVWNHQGQAYTFASTNRIQFVSIADERRQERAEAAECLDEAGLAFPAEAYDRMKATLGSLGLRHRRVPGREVAFADRFVSQAARLAPIPSTSARRWNAADPGEALPGLVDATYGTAVEGAPGEGVWLDLGRTCRVARIWLVSPHPYQEAMPSGFEVEASADGGRSWKVVHGVADRFPNAFRLEKRVYVNALLGRCELAVEAQADVLRIRFPAVWGGAPAWRIEDLVVLEDLGEGRFTASEELDRIVTALRARGSPFAATDRWLSARLRASGYAATYARFNPKVLATVRQREQPLRPGCAFLVPAGWAELTRRRLQAWSPGGDPVAETLTTGTYAILFTRDPADPVAPSATAAPAWIWNDHFLMTGPRPAWR